MSDQVTDPAILAQLNGAQAVTDPNLIAQLNGAKATAGNRIQAGEAGFNKGLAYLLASPADLGANAIDNAAYDVARSGISNPFYSAPSGSQATPIPKSTAPWRSYPAGRALARVMNKAPNWTPTEPERPDDPASRYIAAGTSMVPGMLAFGGANPSTVGGAGATGVANEFLAEHPPFKSSTGNNLLQAGGSLLAGGLAGEMIPWGRPIAQTPQNLAVEQGTARGYKFPAATTNPNPITKTLTRVAGGATVQDAAQENNQELTAEAARSDANLPGSGPINRDAELGGLRRTENQNYQAARSGGPITRDQDMVTALQNAKARFTGASQMSPTLAGTRATRVIDEIAGGGVGTQFDAGYGVDTVGMLRDRAYAAALRGRNADAAAYRASADAIEGAMDRGLPNGIVDAWRNARSRLAVGHLVEDAMDPNGNVDATKLGKMYADGDARFQYAPELAVAARSANAAPKAFRVPETGPTGGHGGFWGPLTGAGVLGEALHGLVGPLSTNPLVGEAAGTAPLLAYGTYVGSRALSRPLALSRALSLARQGPNMAAPMLGTYAEVLGKDQ